MNLFVVMLLVPIFGSLLARFVILCLCACDELVNRLVGWRRVAGRVTLAHFKRYFWRVGCSILGGVLSFGLDGLRSLCLFVSEFGGGRLAVVVGHAWLAGRSVDGFVRCSCCLCVVRVCAFAHCCEHLCF